MDIRRDDLTHPAVHALLEAHLRDMRRISPPESVHALDVAGLRQPGLTFWTAWEGEALLGCAALRELDPRHGEVKSMRTAEAHRRSGVARELLLHLLAEAARRGYTRVSLETGSQPDFEPARRLYARFGFQPCDPFGPYREDRHSVFMTLPLPESPAVEEALPFRPLRSLLAGFLGWLAVVALSLGTDHLLQVAGVFPGWGTPIWEPRLNALALTYRCAYAVAGSFLAARLAPRNPMRHALALGWIGLALGLLGAWVAHANTFGPAWYPLALAGSALPCAWLGGRLARRAA